METIELTTPILDDVADEEQLSPELMSRFSVLNMANHPEALNLCAMAANLTSLSLELLTEMTFIQVMFTLEQAMQLRILDLDIDFTDGREPLAEFDMFDKED